MEREILFRGKRIDNGEWVEGDVLKSDEQCFIVPRMGVVCIEEYKHADTNKFIQLYAYEVDPETVCQYTGLIDKNDRKIFEGDIIKYHFGEDVAPVKFGSYQSCFDSQKTEHCGFYVGWSGDRHFRKDLGYWVHMVDAEIVGNIHDNPELLEGDSNF